METGVSVLAGATGDIIGSNIDIQASVHTDGGSRALGLLIKHCCIGAQLDSNERFDPPRCDPMTRVTITKEMMDWVAGGDESASAMILHGPAGVGKSALAQSVAEICQQEGRLASTHFLSRTALNPMRSNGNAVIPTLVYQLIQVFPWLKYPVLKEIEDNPGILELSRAVQMDRLFIKHFNQTFVPFSADLTKPRLVVLDGLDESSDPDIQCDLLRLFITALPRLSYPFRFLIACRPESHLMAVINRDPAFQTDHIRQIDLGEDPDSAVDICVFLLNEFERIRNTHSLGQYLPEQWPSQHEIMALVQRASGQFIYANTVIRFLRSPKKKPDNQLRIVLGLAPSPNSNSPFGTLDALYRHILSGVKDISILWSILGMIQLRATPTVIAKGVFYPISITSGINYPSPSFLEKALNLNHGEINFHLEELASVIKVVSRDAEIKVLYASLLDLLLDPVRAGDLSLDLSLTHRTIAESYLSEMDFVSRDLRADPGPMAVIFALLSFFYHCRCAKLSPRIVDTMGHAVPFFLTYYSDVDRLGLNFLGGFVEACLRNIGQVFRNKDYPRRPPSRGLMDSIALLWHHFGDCPSSIDANTTENLPYKEKMMAIFQPMVDTLRFVLTYVASESRRGRTFVDSVKDWTTGFMWFINGNSARRAPGDLELAWELTGNGPETPLYTQGAMRAAAFLVFVQMICRCTDPNVINDPDPPSFWAITFLKLALRDKENGFESIDAATLLIALLLLRYCRSNTSRSQLEFGNSTDFLLRFHSGYLALDPSPGLFNFPKLMKAFQALSEGKNT
ncbi:unnamed protein product [Cyclocybe aegerita]|uniref:Nephrocystin 3-like N-terminal domain-containing protein n=1 Tax=Cyclocybe aegerita TaxID=1973307 RepID=A0A8S0WFA4_CYCAE|nr:unnamed protein product [Cyclocybe aegerita]